jgi:hypothetical protein
LINFKDIDIGIIKHLLIVLEVTEN